MANKYDLSGGAVENLKGIWKHIAERNPTAADKFMREFAKKFQLLADNPKIGRTHDEIVLNLRSFPYKDYIIFYFLTENGVEIYRVFHSARDIGSLFEEFFEGLKP
jgi:toxin ParE1/3/4